jgi:type IV fimbrial biogenesis protein FimT
MLGAPRHCRGVTLVEMMIGLAIVALLLMAGVPAFTTFLQNSKLRTTAEALSGGLQLARAEAVKRNGQVEIVLTDDDPIAATVNSITPSTTGRNWVVRYYDPTTLFYSFVEGRFGSTSGSLDTTPVVVTAANATIAFNGFGSTSLAATSTFQVTNPTGGACAASGGPMRCLNVTVTPGGQIHMCDPAVTAAGDTRKC